jgi:hypothetical protein
MTVRCIASRFFLRHSEPAFHCHPGPKARNPGRSQRADPPAQGRGRDDETGARPGEVNMRGGDVNMRSGDLTRLVNPDLSLGRVKRHEDLTP